VRYATIVADPPWDVKAGPPLPTIEGWENKTESATRDLAYPKMSVQEISGLDVPADRHAHLYLWTINAYVDAAYDVARAWGFTPSTLIVWAKNPMGGGLGGAFGITTEFVLFARKGSLRHTGRVVGTWFNWKRPYDARGKPKHSSKPPAFLDLVEQVSPGPYLEMFARSNRLGWETWGNEALEHVELTA
jgi:N6-adenosine-specific RNA methylase IME4